MFDDTSGNGFNSNLTWSTGWRCGASSLYDQFQPEHGHRDAVFQTLGLDVAHRLGILGTSQSPANYGPPSLGFTNFSGLNDANASHSAVETFGVTDMLTLRKGNTQFQFRRRRTHFLNNLDTDRTARIPSVSQDSPPLRYQRHCREWPGYDFARFPAGASRKPVRSGYGDTSTYYRSNGYNAFAVDDFASLPASV